MRFVSFSVTTAALMALGNVATAFVVAPPSLSLAFRGQLAAGRAVSLKAETTATAAAASARTDFDLKAYFAERLPLIETALKESVVSTEPETDLIVESFQ